MIPHAPRTALLAVAIASLPGCFSCGGCESDCGDGECDPTEDCFVCAVDCACASCGDFVCSAGEDANSCPQDCSGVCGDGICSEWELCCCPIGKKCDECCEADCLSGPCPCGDGVCDPLLEDEVKCPKDCKKGCGFCGDSLCAVECGEACDTCWEDCGACGGMHREITAPGTALLEGIAVDFYPTWAESYAPAAACDETYYDPPGTGSTTYVVALADDDDSVPILLPFSFTFFASIHSEAWVGANGYLTFGGPDFSTTPTTASHYGMPRLSPLFADLSGGTVVVDEFITRVNITWSGWGDANGPAGDFQVTIRSTGEIRFVWLANPAVLPALVGISDGIGPGGDLWVLYPLC